MSSDTMYRANGLTLLLGAALFIFGSILSFADQPVAPLWLFATGIYICGMTLQLLGLPGIIARQVNQTGWFGVIGSTLTFLGWFLLTGFYVVDDLILSPWLDALAPHVYAQWFFNPAVSILIHVANLLLGAGAAMLGIATVRARVLPTGAGLLLIVAAAADFGSFVIGNLTTVAVGLVVLSLGWMGYALWSMRGVAVPHLA